MNRLTISNIKQEITKEDINHRVIILLLEKIVEIRIKRSYFLFIDTFKLYTISTPKSLRITI